MPNGGGGYSGEWYNGYQHGRVRAVAVALRECARFILFDRIASDPTRRVSRKAC